MSKKEQNQPTISPDFLTSAKQNLTLHLSFPVRPCEGLVIRSLKMSAEWIDLNQAQMIQIGGDFRDLTKNSHRKIISDNFYQENPENNLNLPARLHFCTELPN